jgi:hypothetical protein
VADGPCQIAPSCHTIRGMKKLLLILLIVGVLGFVAKKMVDTA